MHHTDAFGLGFDVVDALTGPAIGRPKSATYRTADVVGLDTMAHVIKTMADTLPDDPWHRYFEAPAWLAALIEKGALGQKTGAGVYRKAGKDIQVLDLGEAATIGLRRSEASPTTVATILAIRDPAEKFAALRASRRSAGAVPVGDVPRPFPLHARSISPTSPKPRAMSISRSAGATAGSSARSKPGRRRAGSRSRSGSPKTSPPARP